MGTTLKPLSPEALRAELAHAWRTIFLVLIALWITKSVGGGILGTALATVAMGLPLSSDSMATVRSPIQSSVGIVELSHDLKLVGVISW